MSGNFTIVIILDHASVTGGQAKVALASALGLKQAGHHPILFTAAAPVDPRLAAAGIEVICLNQFDLVANPSKAAAAVQGIWNPRAVAELDRLLARLPRATSVVHVHGWAKALSPAIAMALRRSGLPCVYTMHDYFLFCANGGFYNYRQGKSCPLVPQSAACWKTNCDSRSYADKLWRATRTAVMKNIARLPNVFSDIILLTAFQRPIVARYLPPKARVHLVGNPIDARPRGEKTNPASGDFLFVGRLSPEKGALCFAEAARRANIIPVFAGDGSAAQELLQRYPEARLLGWQTAEQVMDLMRDARVLVFPSLWYETHGLTPLEAMSLGTPVIVSDGCAARDSVKDGVSGLWFSNNDPESLADALRNMQDDERAAQMSRAAYRQFWDDPPTIAYHTDKLSRIYSRMILSQERT